MCIGGSHLGSFISRDIIPQPSSKIDLFIGIISHIGEFDRRKTIRDTWYSEKDECCPSDTIDIRFFVSIPSSNFTEMDIEIFYKEYNSHRDIVILKHTKEDYFRITEKTLEIMRVANERGKYTHVAKTDTDTYVRLKKLMFRIKNMPKVRSIMGKIFNDLRSPDRSGKWAVSEEEYPFRDFPKYAQGSLYVLTQDIVSWISSSMRVNSKFKLEDVSMGMWITFMGGGVSFDDEPLIREEGCKPGDISSHYQTIYDMECIHRANYESLRLNGEPYNGCCK